MKTTQLPAPANQNNSFTITTLSMKDMREDMNRAHCERAFDSGYVRECICEQHKVSHTINRDGSAIAYLE